VTSPAPKERIVRLGDRQHLAGILTLPHELRAETPFVVLVSAGVVHRVGPNRLYVDLARSIAAKGYPVLRFDLSGLGDSETVQGGASLTESVLADVRTALDFLQHTRGASSFIIGGLCSGANDSMLAAFADSRVTGVLLIDPSVPRTRRSVLVHHARRLQHPATWAKLLTLQHPLVRRSLGWLRSLEVARAADGQSQLQHMVPAQQPSQAETRLALRTLIERGVQLMFVFTGGINHQYNYRDQLFDVLPGFDFRDQMRLEFMPDTDHTVSDRVGRAHLLRAIGDWMHDSFSLAERSRASL